MEALCIYNDTNEFGFGWSCGVINTFWLSRIKVRRPVSDLGMQWNGVNNLTERLGCWIRGRTSGGGTSYGVLVTFDLDLGILRIETGI